MLEHGYPRIVPTPHTSDVDRRMIVKCDHLNVDRMAHLFEVFHPLSEYPGQTPIFYDMMNRSESGDLTSDLEILLEKSRNRRVVGYWKLSSVPFDDWTIFRKNAGGFLRLDSRRSART